MSGRGARPGIGLVSSRLVGILMLTGVGILMLTGVLAQEPSHCPMLDCSQAGVTEQCPLSCAGEGWVEGAPEGSCTDACAAQGLVCTPEGFSEHNADIDSSDKVLTILQSWNWSFLENGSFYTDHGQVCLDTFGTGAAVPNFQHHVCYYSAPDRAVDTFDCERAPQDSKRRICWCHTPPSALCNEGWRDSGPQKESCSFACANCGMVCTEEALQAHNTEVDTDVEVRALITTVGGTTQASVCNPMYGTEGAVPKWSDEACYFSQADRDASTYFCAAVPAPGEHRLCYCHAPVPTTTSIIGTPSFNVISGPCQRVDDGQCIQSPNYPALYGYSQSCEIAVTAPGTVIAPVAFSTEETHDMLTVNGVTYHGTSATGLDGIVPSTNIYWTSDYSASMSGWKICTQATTEAIENASTSGNQMGGNPAPAPSSPADSSDSVPVLPSLGSQIVSVFILFGAASF